MSSALTLLIVVGAIGIAVIKRCEWFNICGNPFSKTPSPSSITTPNSSSSTTPSITTASTNSSNGGCNPELMKAMLHPHDAGMNLQFGECVTVTGTVVGQKEPHYAPDGDLVFSLKLDPQFQHLVNDKNNAAKYQGGIWCEAVCVSKNNSTDPWHKGDCSQGGPFPKFPTPKRGDRLRVTGIHTIDNGEGGHAEIHPVSNIEFLSAPTTTTTKKKSSKYSNVVYDRIAI